MENKPLKMTTKDFDLVLNKPVSLKCGKREITGRITQVYLAYNSPNLPGNFDFEISPESEVALKKEDIDSQKNFGILEVNEINLL